MPKAIRIHQTDEPEVLAWEDIAVGKPDAVARHRRSYVSD
jgi:hypothetical protein